MRLILKYLKNYKLLVVVNVISVFGFALVELGIPTIMAKVIDSGIANKDIQYIKRMGGVIVLISILGVAGTILLGYCSAKISTGITRDIRNDIFKKAQEASAHNAVAQYLAEQLVELFTVIAECIRDGLMLEHADPLPSFADMLNEEYLWSEEYDEDEDILRYEEEEVFPDDLFFSFYYYSLQVLLLGKPLLDEANEEEGKLLELLTEIDH